MAEEIDLAEAAAHALAAARAAGDLQLRGLGRHTVAFKGNRSELVTEVDRECERLIAARLLERYPDHDLFGEEEVRRDDRKSPYRWIIDPLDGTTNYAHQLPFFCSAIALEERFPDGSSEVVAGAVHAPVLKESFHGYRGGGAFLNDGRLMVSRTAVLEDALLVTGFAYVRNETPNDNQNNWAAFNKLCRGVRRLGSAALDLCYTAAGRFDGFWEMHLQPYDVAAGALFIREAGGRVTDTEGGDDWLFGRRVIASNGHLHEAIRAVLAPVVPDGFITFNPRAS